MLEIDINEFYRASTSIKQYNIIMLFKIKNSKNDEPQSQFFQLNQQLFTLLSLQFLQSYTTNFQQTLLFCFLFSESYT